jgi:hypothetical protein
MNEQKRRMKREEHRRSVEAMLQLKEEDRYSFSSFLFFSMV